MELANQNFTINMAPEMELYYTLQSLNYGIETALSEFIDNSIQSFRDNEAAIKKINPKANFHIDISINDNEIIIEDNAGGIKKDNFARAFKLGIKPGSHDANSLSYFGIGMKTAANWFTKHWKLETCAINTNEKLTFEFDLDSLVIGNKTDAEVISTITSDNEHYTKITLKNHIRNESEVQYTDYIVPFIVETFLKYKDFVNINFKYNNKNILPKPDKTLLDSPKIFIYPVVNKKSEIITDKKEAIQWYVDIDINYHGKKITGFIMIRETASYKNPGIRLLRNNRVIKGVSVKANLPEVILGTSNKFASQRIYGELNLNDFAVDFMKTNINESLNELYEYIKKILEEHYVYNLIAQASDFRVKSKKDAHDIDIKNIRNLWLKSEQKPESFSNKSTVMIIKHASDSKKEIKPNDQNKTKLSSNSKVSGSNPNNIDNKIVYSNDLEEAFNQIDGMSKIISLYKL